MRNLLSCCRGASAFVTVVALTPLIGAVALGAEAASWYVTKQQAQSAADAAAYSGALRLACTGGGCDAQTVDYRGKEFAARNGFCNAKDTGYPGSACLTSLAAGVSQSVQITVGNYSGGTFAAASNGTAVQAVVSQTQPTYLAGVLGLSSLQVGATAVAQVNTTAAASCTSNCGCILQKDTNPSGGTGLSMSNGANMKSHPTMYRFGERNR